MPALLVSDRVTALAVLVICLVVLYVMMIIQGEKRKKVYPIRRLAPVDAFEEAVGRAVETGRPIHYAPGSVSLRIEDTPQTLASFAILGYVAGLAAKYNCRIIVTAQHPEVYAVVVEIVREAFVAQGKADQFREDDVMYLPQLKAAAGVMQREHVAANFLIGSWAHESLVLVEAGAAAGAINLGGTARMDQIPFLASCCDYCLIGEEVFGAAAYITKDPIRTSTIAGQDYLKFMFLALIVVATILSTMGQTQLTKMFG